MKANKIKVLDLNFVCFKTFSNHVEVFVVNA